MAKERRDNMAAKLIAERANKKIYRDGDKIIKVFNHLLTPKAEVLAEATNYARVEITELDMPHVTQVYRTDNDDWAIITDFIEGPTLQELIDREPEKKAAYIAKLVELQMLVHSKSCPLLPKMKDKLNNRISNSGLDASTRYELHMRLENMPRHLKLCHGDFNPSNIILSNTGRYFILDWAHATQGNASCDAAFTYLEFLMNDDQEGAELYIREFCQKTDTAIQYVQKWIPIAAVTRSVKAKEEERLKLLKFVDVVEYE